MVRGEDKQFEQTVDHLIEYAKNIKISLLVFIQRIEAEGDNLEWPQILDSFTTICGQINTLLRFTRENKTQFIENRVLLPLLLSPDRDEELFKLTEGRVQMVNHEMVPDYLRTKPDPEIEEAEKALQMKADTITPENAVKQINAMNKIIDNTINTIKANSLRADNEMARHALKPSHNSSDTSDLIMAVSNGKGLRQMVGVHRGQSQIGLDQQQHAPVIVKPNIKPPELKTNIKAGP